jgi:SAM-dependent methyltransferase
MAEQSNRAGDGRMSGIAEYFSRLAPTYGDGEYYSSRRAAVLRALEPELAQARRMLDLGCGNGRYLAEFVRHPELELIVGADLSGEMLAAARRRAGSRPYLVRCSAEALPFGEGVFDLIFASHVFPFVSSPDAAVRGVAARLRARGRLVATVGRGPIHDYVREVIPAAESEAFSRAAFPLLGRRGVGGEDIARHRAAFAASQLAIERRAATFSVGWDGIVEWIRLRWLAYATDTERDRVEKILAAVPAGARRRSFDITEDLLIGERPA